MLNKNVTNNRNESGNALFLILIAVALFAALSYAVTQSGRGSGTVDKETALIAAAQITQYPAALRSTVTRMVITGTGVSAIRYDTTSGVGVFAADGGASTNQAPPGNIGTITLGGLDGATNNAWGYKDTSDALNGYYITGVGTDTTVSGAGRDHLAYLSGLTATVCQQTLKGLGLSTTLVGQTAAVDFTTNLGEGGNVANGAAGVGSANFFNATGMSGNSFACTSNGTAAAGPYVYYHALVEQ